MTAPYFETFTWDFDDPALQLGFVCNICAAPVGDAPCPEHGPGERVGPLVLVECDATPRHPHVWATDGDHYGAPCMYCCYQRASDAHAGCAHARHWPWRRWKVTGRADYWLTILGVIGGGSAWTLDGHCRGCRTWRKPLTGKRSYILGKRREWWSCLLVGRHIRGDELGLGLCAKCVPCPTCGSPTLGHVAGCADDTGWAA